MHNHWKNWEATGEATGRPLGRPLGGHWEATVHIPHSVHGFITLQTGMLAKTAAAGVA